LLSGRDAEGNDVVSGEREGRGCPFLREGEQLGEPITGHPTLRCDQQSVITAGMASVTGLADRWWRHHEVSMLTAAVAGAGRCFGWQPAAKVSMMIIRPPQQRQGRGSTWGSSAAAVLDVSACVERDGTSSSAREKGIQDRAQYLLAAGDLGASLHLKQVSPRKVGEEPFGRYPRMSAWLAQSDYGGWTQRRRRIEHHIAKRIGWLAPSG
jgi:hypothetical protein